MKITRGANNRHEVELSSGELAAMVNLFNGAMRSGVRATELQEEIFTTISRHVATVVPDETSSRTQGALAKPSG